MKKQGQERREMNEAASRSKMAKTMRELLPYTQLGWQMVATILLFFGIGYGLDGYLDMRPVLTVTGAVVGVIAAMIGFFRQAHTILKEK